MEGKWRTEGERGPRKRPRVVMEEIVGAEETDRWQKEYRGLQLGAKITEVLWILNNHLVLIKEELAVSQEAMAEELRLLHQLLTQDLRQIVLALGGRRGQEEEGELEVKGLGEKEGLEERAEEQAEGAE